MSRPTSASTMSTGRAGSRFARAAPVSSFERPPIVLEWGSAVIRIGYTEQFRPQCVVPWKNKDTPMSERQWYSVVAPMISRIWDQLFLAPNAARRVVCVHPPYMPLAWTWAMTKALANQGVPGVCFINGMDTIPYAMGWKRGMVVDVGRTEARLQAHVDGNALHETFQVVPCGFEAVTADTDSVLINWDKRMEWHWLDERNPSSLMVALLKSLEATPLVVRKDVAANIVFIGGTLLGVPDLGRRVGQRLVSSLLKRATREPSPVEEFEPHELTVTPTQWTKLASLESHVSIVSTEPHRADGISWLGASVWATVCHSQEGYIKWISPQED